tara:strand:+ start:225 stop:644 length:420 start_codon:yes stop_codon:yes gene_type:complete
MGEEFYSILKLMSGEEIFSLISVDENNGNPVIILQNPLVMKVMESSKGSYVKVKKWVELSEEDMYVISYDKILTLTECKDNKLISIYNNYISDEGDIGEIYKSSGKVKITDQMGYISNVEDARKKFEVLFKINQEPKES